jgi:acetyl-CoA carboxylase / biotin carboxylase 1
MKMYMPLVASEDGIVQFVKQPGVSLEPGDILGILTLDDPARVKHAKPFDGLLPKLGAPNVVGNKPSQRFAHDIEVLGDILKGYDNQAIMASTFSDLVEVLHNPELPFSELSAILSSLSGRLPSKLEDSIRSSIETSKAKGDFPAARLKKTIDNFIEENVRAQDRTIFRTNFGALIDVVERHLGGPKVHEMNTLADLLQKYEGTEKLFGGSIEARVLALREQFKEDPGKVAALVLSHIKAQSKAKLVLTILEYIKTSGLPISNAESRINQVMQGLAVLESKYASSIFFLSSLVILILF